MPIKINELVIQVKICETKQNIEEPAYMQSNAPSEQQRSALIVEYLTWLEDREAR